MHWLSERQGYPNSNSLPIKFVTIHLVTDCDTGGDVETEAGALFIPDDHQFLNDAT